MDSAEYDEEQYFRLIAQLPGLSDLGEKECWEMKTKVNVCDLVCVYLEGIGYCSLLPYVRDRNIFTDKCVYVTGRAQDQRDVRRE